ncbi:hypothetical protein BOX15_Mlig031439g1 [Macrostomum lignano]|uniref:TAFH domain-containing protein n=1 Tax=Macrostomum lignano TaxID=282301 RepID=A0A267G647_9PLAT|nr:hypothetical protein BOX15_Mlig031439g1 [Macrostomum lignano]
MGDSRAFQAPNGAAQLRLVHMAPPQSVRPSEPSAAGSVSSSAASVIRMPSGQQLAMGPNIVLRHPSMPQYVLFHGNGGQQIIARPAAAASMPQAAMQSRPPVSHVAVCGVAASPGVPVGGAPTQVSAGGVSNESIAKCSNFLSVLQRLSRENSEDNTRPQRVTQLIRDVVEERLPVPDFVNQLKEALGSSTNSDQLLGFLNLHLPNYRRAYRQGLIRLDSPMPQQQQSQQQQQQLMRMPAPTVVRAAMQPMMQHSRPMASTVLVAASTAAPLPSTATAVSSATSSAVPVMHAATSSAIQQKQSVPSDDNLADTKSFVGANIKNENEASFTAIAVSSASVTAVSSSSAPAAAAATAVTPATAAGAARQCPDQGVLFGSGSLQRRLINLVRSDGLLEVSDSAVAFLSAAVERRLTDILEQAAAAAEHRSEPLAAACPYLARTDDAARRLKFLAGLDAQEKQRKDEEERERLLRAAKSRAKMDDPEQQKLKQKARELQEAEYEQDKQDKANETAALAIFGSSRKRPFFGAGPGGGGGSGGGGSSGGIGGGLGSLGSKRPKHTRVGMRDLLMALQSDSRAPKRLLYKAAS